jgi:hypothetical protein
MPKYKDDEITQFLKKLEELCFVLYMAKKTITEEEFAKKTSEILKFVKDFKKDK